MRLADCPPSWILRRGFVALAGSVVLVSALTGCVKSSAMAAWLESPVSGAAADGVIRVPGIGVALESPTLLALEGCEEAEHVRNAAGEVAVLTCVSEGPEPAAFYVSARRGEGPLDATAVDSARAAYEGSGMIVNAISYEPAYHGKAGLRASLQTADGARSIVEFVVRVADVDFVLRLDSATGDERPFEQDWAALLFNLEERRL